MKKTLAVLMSVLMLLVAVMPNAFAAMDESLLYGDTVITSDKEYRVVGNVIERNIILNNAEGSEQRKCFVLEIDLNNPDLSIMATYKDAEVTTDWERTTVRSQARAAELKYGVNVVGAINGGFYSTETGEPSGLLIMNGKLGHASNGSPYFAILNDGTAVLREGNVSTADVKEAVAGKSWLVKNGKNVAPANKLNPRTAVGIKEDGTVVFFVVDGRQDPDSVGMDYPEVAACMLALGCVTALELDGGGSSTMLAKREASDLNCSNSPSYGYERTVATSLLVVTSAQPSGVFDHVTFSESLYLCSPMESVTVSAVGVDANGFSAKIPAGGSLQLANDSLGKLNGNKFVSNGEIGYVDVNYVLNGEVVATSVIRVTHSADNIFESLYNRIMQFFYNIINTIKLLIDKFDEKILSKM